jgi:hypothetical protein
MSDERLQVQQKDPVGETVWSLQRKVAALQTMANDPQPFYKTEIRDLRMAAHDLLLIAAQAEANMQLGSRA